MSDSAERRLAIIEAILGIRDHQCGFPECSTCGEKECPLLDNTIREISTQIDTMREVLQNLEGVLSELKSRGVVSKNRQEIARLRVEKTRLEEKAAETKALLSGIPDDGALRALFQTSLDRKALDIERITEALEELESETE